MLINMIIWLMLMTRNTGSVSYGYYKFFKNHGESFYDYGAGTHHAYNGSTPESDSNDGVHSDRGVYLDGASSYVTIHNVYWGTPPTFVIPFEFSVFLLVLSEGPLIYRYDSNNEMMLNVRLLLNGVIRTEIARTDDGGVTYTLLAIESPSGQYFLNEWNHFNILMKEHTSGFKYTLRINLLQVSNGDQGGYPYLETSACHTLLAHDATDFLEGIVYSANFYSSNHIHESDLFAKTCTPHDLSCNVCTDDTKTCLHHSPSPNYNNDGVSCSPCSDGCLTDMTCLDCSANSLPFCESSPFLPIPSVCDPSCSDCLGPGVEDCTGCTAAEHHLINVPGECTCTSGSPDPNNCSTCASGCLVCSIITMCEVCEDTSALPKSDGSGQCECEQYFFDSDPSSTLVCDPCHTDCDACDSLSQCLTCKDTNASPSLTEGCDCPTNSAMNNGLCECLPEYFDSDVGSPLVCDVCHEDCSTCNDNLNCSTCKDPKGTPSINGGCDCPSGFIKINGLCECASGFFLNSSDVCQSCPTDCLTCDSSECITCAVVYALPAGNQTCICPSNSSSDGLQCVCDPFFYDSAANILQCDACHSDCSTCSDPSSCLACKDPSAIPNPTEGCDCTANAAMNNGSCQCAPGYFKDNQDACEECPEDCIECNSTRCTVCALSKAIPEDGHVCKCPLNATAKASECECNDGYFLNNSECLSCHEDCETCEDSNQCLTCKDISLEPTEGCRCPLNSSLHNGECVCVKGYFKASSEVCEACEVGCVECYETVCLECLDDWAILKDGDCECPENSEMKNGVCGCLEGYEKVSSSCLYQKSVHAMDEIFKFKDSTVTLLSSILGFILASLAVFVENPMTIWTSINSMQLLSYIPLHNMNMTDRMHLVTTEFEITEYIPNIVLLLNGRPNQQFMTEKKNWEECPGSFYENIGECITTSLICIGVLLIYAISYIVFPCFKKGIRNKLAQFKFNVFLRLFLELYLVLVFAGIISFHNLTEHSETDTENLIGSIVFVLCVFAPVMTSVLLYKLKERIEEGNEWTIKSFGTLFKEFHITRDFSSLLFYPSFLTRRLIYIVSLFYFYDYPNLQFTVDISSCLCIIFITKMFVKFKSEARKRFELASEISFSVIFICLSILRFNGSDMQTDVIELTIVAIAFGIITVNFLYMLFVTFKKMAEKVSNKTKKKTTVIPMKNSPGLIDDEPVFALVVNRQVNDTQRENESYDQDQTVLNNINQNY